MRLRSSPGSSRNGETSGTLACMDSVPEVDIPGIMIRERGDVFDCLVAYVEFERSMC